MSIESELFTALTSLTAGRVYPDEAPADAVMPYIVFQQVGGSAPSFLDNAIPSARNARMQVTAWASTRLAASALSLQISDALMTCSTFSAKPIGAMVALRDPDTKASGAAQDFSIWDQR